jgi:hypothetical protein
MQGTVFHIRTTGTVLVVVTESATGFSYTGSRTNTTGLIPVPVL